MNGSLLECYEWCPPPHQVWVITHLVVKKNLKDTGYNGPSYYALHTPEDYTAIHLEAEVMYGNESSFFPWGNVGQQHLSGVCMATKGYYRNYTVM